MPQRPHRGLIISKTMRKGEGRRPGSLRYARNTIMRIWMEMMRTNMAKGYTVA